MSVSDWVSAVLLTLGAVVMTLGVLGAWRMPDVYGKLHAGGKAATVGVLLVLAGAVAGTGDGVVATRAVLIAALMVLTAPTGTHAIAQAARRRAGQSRDAEPATDG